MQIIAPLAHPVDNRFILKELSAKIIQRREYLSVTQQMLSDISGVSLRTVKSIEKGTSSYSIANLMRIADALGLEINLTIKQMNL